MADTKPKHVLIAGAGIGGLALAQCLRAKGVKFTVFDRDSAPHARSQGWAIGLHTVLATLISSMPDDMPPIDVTNHLLPLDHLPAQMKFYMNPLPNEPVKMSVVESKSAEEVGYSEGRIIRSNRDRLRDWLLTNIEVQWGKQISGFTQDENGVIARFEDGTTVHGDMLVGADGVRSVVRQTLLPEARLSVVPDCFLTGELTLPKGEYEKQLELGHSCYVIAGKGQYIFVGLNRIADDASSAEYYWHFIFRDDTRRESHWTDSASGKEIHDFVLQRTAHFDPKYTELIRLTDPKNVKTPPLVLRDLILERMPVSKVTLLGDAGHPMTPYRGEGGTHALTDAINLARVIAEDGSLGDYQDEMLRRGAVATRASRTASDTEPREGAARRGPRIAWGQPARMVTAEG